MHFLSLLRKPLKSDQIIALLEDWDSEVVYEFDRTHENLPDEYWACSKSQGVQLLFDEHQRLKCIFLHVLEDEGFSPVDLSDSDILPFESAEQVAAYAGENRLETSDGSAPLLGVVRDWIRLEWSAHWVHYEFRGGLLGLITLTAR